MWAYKERREPMANEELRLQNLDRALETAYNLYLQYGIDKVTKEMIAKECGLSRKSIDRYFPEKTECVIRVMEWFLQRVRVETNKLFPESDFISGEYTGVQLMEKYMTYIKDVFLRDPRTFALYTEFKIYIYRNCENFEQEYTLLANKMGNYRLRHKIYEYGQQDGTLPANIDLKTEEEYFSESFFGFLSNLAFSFSLHSRKEMEKQIDHRIKNTVALYTGGGYIKPIHCSTE
jgi:AcrR family transcriptional regulator